MNILFIADRYWPAVGGVESYLRDLTRCLQRQHHVSVIAVRADDGPSARLTGTLDAPPSFEPFDDGGVAVRQLRVPGTRRLRLAPMHVEAIPILRRHSYGKMRVALAAHYARVVAAALQPDIASADVVHAFGHGYAAHAALRSARSLRKPIVVTPFAHAGQWGDDPASARLYRRTDRVLGLLEVEARLYTELGTPASRVEVVGVCSPGLVPPPDERIRCRYDIEGPLVVFLGVRRPYKGFDVLLEAARLLAGSAHRPSFAFLGPGDPLPETPADVHDVGQVSDEEKSAWLQAADLVCLPSRGEIFPVSILESWSAGTPVLTSDIPTLTELVAMTGGGWTVRPEPPELAARLEQLLSNPEALLIAGQRGKTMWTERWTVDAVSAAHERIYEQVSRPSASP